jgi:hypothetical protein
MGIRKGELHEGERQVHRYLTEGCCPNCHVPMHKVAEKRVVCARCDFEWNSPRVAVIFPKRELT